MKVVSGSGLTLRLNHFFNRVRRKAVGTAHVHTDTRNIRTLLPYVASKFVVVQDVCRASRCVLRLSVFLGVIWPMRGYIPCASGISIVSKKYCDAGNFKNGVFYSDENSSTSFLLKGPDRRGWFLYV